METIEDKNDHITQQLSAEKTRRRLFWMDDKLQHFSFRRNKAGSLDES